LTGAAASYAFLEGTAEGAPRREPTCAGELAARLLVERRAALESFAAAACRDQQTLVVEGGSAGLIQGLLGRASGDFEPCAALATPLSAHGRSFGALVLVRLAPAPPFGVEDSDVVLTLARQAAVALHGARLKEAEQNFFTHVTEILVQALDMHVDHQEGHSRRVTQYASQIGREMGLEAVRLNRLFFAALLHDIGMLRLDRKQAGDRTAFREHCRLADEMLRPITLWSDIAPLVRHHHERPDGSGYPDALAGEAIPIESRIIAVADTFDVLTAPSSYRPTLAPAEAVREIGACAGAQFDADVVKAFQALVERGEIEPLSGS
jgi:putative nucleotidyltransferase with HDIG domain